MNNDNTLKNLDIITVIDDIKKYLIAEKLDKDNETINYLIFNHILINTINRVNRQDNNVKEEIIAKLRSYCHKNISNYQKKEFYKNISLKRKLIAFLNYNKMHNISKKLLSIKKKMR